MQALLRKDKQEPQARLQRNGSGLRIQPLLQASTRIGDGRSPQGSQGKRSSFDCQDPTDEYPTLNVAGPTACGCISLWILGPLSARALRGLLMQGKFPFRVL